LPGILTAVRTVHLDGHRVDSKDDFMGAVAEALDFPPYFGRNWDALDECLAEVVQPTRVEWSASDRLRHADPDAFEAAVRCFAETPAPVELRLG
jgi:RNAse (barnase) inhibitor barstar